MGKILGSCAKLYGKSTFSDKITSVWSHNVHAQNLAVTSMTDHLNHSDSLTHSNSTATGSKGELAHLVRNAALAGVLFSDADAGDFRISEDTRWNSSIVCLAPAAEGIPRSYLPLLGGNMGQHVLAQNITDGIDSLYVRLKVFIHTDSGSLHLQTEI
jgi:hypothetical protein